MKRHPVDSSVLCSIGYDEIAHRMEVEFQSGAIYQFYGITAALFRQFVSAPSKGRFFDAYIRDRFSTVRIA